MRMPSLTLQPKDAHLTILHFQSLLFNSGRLPLVTVSPQIYLLPLTTKRPKSKLTLPKKRPKDQTLKTKQTKPKNAFKNGTLPIATDNSSYYGELPPWLPGCMMFYLDLGAGVGETIQTVYEPGLFPKSQLVNGLQEKFQGMAKKRNFFSKQLCILGFEPSNKYWSKLQKIERNYSTKGYKLHVFPSAVIDKNENITLYIESNRRKSHWGASIFKSNDSGHKYTRHKVKGISLAKFIKDVLKSKPIPVMKMDIGGAEYGVLLDLLDRGLLCYKYIQLIVAEFHDFPVYNLKFDKHNSSVTIKKRIRKQHCQPTILKNLDEKGNDLKKSKLKNSKVGKEFERIVKEDRAEEWTNKTDDSINQIGDGRKEKVGKDNRNKRRRKEERKDKRRKE